MSISEATHEAARAYRAHHGGSHRAALAFLRAERDAAKWNERWPVGTKCVLETYTGGPKVETVTRSGAWAQSSGHASVLLEGYTGSYGLEWVTPIRPIRPDTIVGRRAGTVVVLSVKRKTVTVRCDCGVVREMDSSAMYRNGVTCGDRAAHPLTSPKTHDMSGDYRYEWHRLHNTCAGWADVGVFVEAVGERPPGHGLSRTSGDVASCGACEDCKTAGTAKSVQWTSGGSATALPVVYEGESMSQAEAARRSGMSRQAVSYRVSRGIPLETVKGGTVEPG